MPLEHQDRDPPAGVDPRRADVEAGFRALDRYLSRHAAFDRWCADQLRRYGRSAGDSAESGSGEAGPRG